MRITKTPFRVASAMTVIAFLSGCTTFVASAYKDESYDKHLTETSVVWIPPTDIEPRVTRMGTEQRFAIISEKDQSEARQATAELLALFTRLVPDTMSKALANAQVKTLSTESAPTELRVEHLRSTARCALGCQYNLLVQVSLFDKSLDKVVWSASVIVGAPFPATNDESVVDNFTKSIVEEMKRASLL